MLIGIRSFIRFDPKFCIYVIPIVLILYISIIVYPRRPFIFLSSCLPYVKIIFLITLFVSVTRDDSRVEAQLHDSDLQWIFAVYQKFFGPNFEDLIFGQGRVFVEDLLHLEPFLILPYLGNPEEYLTHS